jgi:hypothetical protein
MRKRLKIRLAWGCAIATLFLAQIGCSPKANNAGSNIQPSASPNNPVALTSASPGANAASSASPGADVASSAGAPNATGGGFAPTAPGGNPPNNAVAPAPAPTPRIFTIAAGTPITIYTNKTLSTKTDKDGERFVASLARPIVDDDWVIAKKGALVEGVIVNSDPGGRVKGRASMTIRLSSLQLADGRTIDISTNSYTKVARGTKKKDAMKIGIGAGVGAAIGAIAGGGKGAAIGAGVGGGAGTGYVLATRGDPAVIPGESQLTFKLTAPITVTKR